ncbi:MAG: PaaI family thioesterase [Candidatus Binatia bacterium]
MNPNDFTPIDPERAEMILSRVAAAAFPKFVGLRYEEVRRDYARMRLPYRPELNQPAGVVHGGAIATLVDSVVVGAILSGLEAPPRRFVTIDLHVHYLDAVVAEDVIAEARVRRRGGRVVFLEVEVTAADGRGVAHGELSYLVAT